MQSYLVNNSANSIIMAAKVYPRGDADPPVSDWNPVAGRFYTAFTNNLVNFDARSKDILTKESLSILGKCINPRLEQDHANTGSVIGYVQSGKTTSFNALAMLAIDNGFKFIIVLGGRTNNLLNQNREEFERNLSSMLDDSKVNLAPSEIGSISSLNLNRLKQNGSDLFPALPIISVNLKHQGHIRRLTSVLKKHKKILAATNVLIIDDEADNASLNSMVSSEEYDESAVYASIKDMREALPRHSLVQYTATPQALLLISKSDKMSPQWVRFITPGNDYVGTKDFFDDSHATVTIPSDQLLDKNIENFKLPDSLFKALRTYLITAIQAALTGPPVWPPNLTMMIHPHGEIRVQDAWGLAIKEVIEDWRDEIEVNINHWKGKHRAQFKEAYELLRKGVEEEIHDFDKIYEHIPFVVREVYLSVLNSKKNNRLVKTVSWQNNYNIVVGGNLLDRGFVVKGLVTTYMPRKGSINSDTLQQRGRFYGYKRKHLGFLKLWLGNDTIKGFREYREAEDFLYEDLKSWTQNNPDKNLQEWVRRMVLSERLEPCRKAIIGIGLVPKYLNQSGWYWPKEPLPMSSNTDVITRLINSFESEFEPYGDPENWTAATKSLIAEGLDLKEVINTICDYDVSHVDVDQWASVKLSLGRLVHKNYKASVILMGTEEADLGRFHPRQRSFAKQNYQTTCYDDTTGEKYTQVESCYRLKDLHQGRTDETGYPGGKNIHSDSIDTVTFQIHKVTINQPGGNNSYQSLVLAIKMPKSGNIIAEVQAGS